MTFNLSGDEALQVITSIRLQIDDSKDHKRLIEKLLKKDDRENLRHMLAIYNSKIVTLTDLAKYENADGVVGPSTTAVAIKDPLQYGVAHVQIILKKTDSSYLKDADEADIPVETNFPVTGIIIGGQLPVGFDFTPTTAYPLYSEADMKFLYDNQLPTLYLSSSADAAQPINTLALQSYDHKKVPVALELTNNSGMYFKGSGSKILNGTKFYLVGEIDPDNFTYNGTGTTPTEILDRVLTQDYTTTLSIKVTNLKNAYNVVPDLLSPRLEIGIELVPKWVATTPEEILF